VRYNATIAPEPEQWLASDEQERLIAVEEHHRRMRARVSELELHSAIHVTVENQLAEGVTATVDTFERLLDEGLDRHDAIHAIGTVVAELILRGPRSWRNPEDELRRRLALLDARRWRASTGSASPGSAGRTQ